ncbi:hypothetical protein ACFFWD_06260 [Bradyrhizobium erythrophlei]|uniref:hypothetical protein n=1 Tax=Bradyrhizobium erythrophlei TaxID=1437360 RepID=UPI0035EB6A3A
MRFTGWILLLIGLLLCATIAWAALGFLLMGVGLISLQVAERGRRKATFAVAGAAGLELPASGLRPPMFEPVPPREAAPQPPRRRVAWPDNRPGAAYDKEAWRVLVESDPDLAGLAAVLADYGPQYVDELAISYLAAPDKGRLGAIVDGIIARARGQTLPLPPAPPPAVPMPEPQVAALPEDRPSRLPPPLPTAPADDLEAALIAAFEQASAKVTGRGDASKPATAGEGPRPATRREPAFGSVPRRDGAADQPPGRTPPPLPASTPADLEASLIAVVSEASAKRADPPKPAQPQDRPPVVGRREPDARSAPKQPTEVQPPPAPATAPAEQLDASLLAALAEISGDKTPGSADPSKPATAAKDAASPPGDDHLTDMIQKFAPDSSFLRKQ